MVAAMSQSPRRGALLLLLALGFAWGSFWPLMKLALNELPILTFRALCAELGGVLVLALALAARQRLAVPREERVPLLWLSLFTTTGWLYFTALGVTEIGSGRAVLLAYTMPLWSFLFGIAFLNDRPTKRRWLGLVVALSGVAVMVSQDADRLLGAPLGVLAMLAAALSWAGGSVVLKKRVWRTPSLSLVGWQSVVGGAPICLAAALFDAGELRPLSPFGWFAVAYTIVVGTVFGVWAWFRCVQLLSISVASLGVLLVPVIGLSSSALLLDEPLGWPEWTALALIVCGLAAVMPLPRLAIPGLRSRREA
jgi:drug/metabolite transporter (DMT)-like permease